LSTGPQAITGRALSFSMPRLQHVLESVPGGIAVAMFAGNTNQRFARFALSGPVFLRVNPDKRDLALAVL
jgi:hypothetical protein